MKNEELKKHGHGKGAGTEHPKTHFIILGSIAMFCIVWILDFILFTFTIHNMILTNFPQIMLFVLWPIRIGSFLGIFIIAIFFMRASEKVVFDEEDAKSLKNKGIYAHVRNPMYLATPLIFIACIFFSMSLISIIPVVITFILYTKMVKFEEEDLEGIFGEKYLEYKAKVPRWFPRLTAATFEEKA